MNNDSEWISFSDLMTGLMIIFLFISISYMLQVKNEQKEKDEIFEKYQQTRDLIYEDLKGAFSSGFEKWKVDIDQDLTIKITDASALFEPQLVTDPVKLKKSFTEFLNQFTPLFLEIILKPEYQDKISEVRIDGHTGISDATYEFQTEYYQQMIILSQKRSNKVLEYIMNSDSYQNLNEEQKSRFRFFLTSTGLAYGKALDKDGEYKFISKNIINEGKSMRVEFRIITNSEEVIKEWIKKKEE